MAWECVEPESILIKENVVKTVNLCHKICYELIALKSYGSKRNPLELLKKGHKCQCTE
jgi:hypothetical protein